MYNFANISFLYCSVTDLVRLCTKGCKILRTGNFYFQIFVKHIAYLRHCTKIANTALAKYRNVPENSFNLQNIYQEMEDLFIPQIKKKKVEYVE